MAINTAVLTYTMLTDETLRPKASSDEHSVGSPQAEMRMAQLTLRKEGAIRQTFGMYFRQY